MYPSLSCTHVRGRPFDFCGGGGRNWRKKSTHQKIYGKKKHAPGLSGEKKARTRTFRGKKSTHQDFQGKKAHAPCLQKSSNTFGKTIAYAKILNIFALKKTPNLFPFFPCFAVHYFTLFYQTSMIPTFTFHFFQSDSVQSSS